LFVPVSDAVFVLLTLGALLFSMGAFVGSYDHRPYRQRNYVLEGTLPSGRAVGALAMIVALGLALYIKRVLFLASTGPSTNPFVNLRFAVSINQDETGGIGFVQYFVWLAYLLVAITIIQRKGLPKGAGSPIAVVAAVLIGLTFGVLSSGRGPVLALIIIVVGIPLTLRATRPGRAAVGLVLVALLLFVGVGVALGKGGTVGSSLTDNWVTMRESFLTYSAGGIPALSQFIENRGSELDFGFNSLRSLFAVLRALGFSTSVAPLVQPYADIPAPFNAYTVYQPYVKDFGLLGAVPVLFLLGFLHAILYRRATTRHPHASYVFLFTISMFPLVMQVFQDMYFSLLSLWIQYGVYSVIFFVLVNDSRKRHERLRLRPVGV
jgi:oligosaccharide repeat unit polymerase